MLTAEAYEDVVGVELPFMKARPATEGDRRFIFTEPSNERWDTDDERVRQRALAASAEDFLRFGNLDLNHLTLFGWKLKIDNPHLYEIGTPLEVIADGKRFIVDRVNGERRIRVETGGQYANKPVMVKGEIYRGTGIAAAKANFFWSSLTEQDPPQDWYPSVGGTKPTKIPVGSSRKEIVAVNWRNIGFAKEPVNHHVSPLTLLAPAEFLKAVMAGYGTDSAALTGGAALRRQSHGGIADATAGEQSKFKRAAMAYLRRVGTGTLAGKATLESVCGFFRDHAGVDADTAKAWAGRLMADLRDRLQQPAPAAA